MATMLPYPRTLFAAWVETAYGPGGFWTVNEPAAHFRTAAGLTVMAEAVLGVLDEVGLDAVVEVGAGDGRLLATLNQRRPGLSLLGIDLRARPTALPAGVGWAQDRWDVLEDRWTGGEAYAALTTRPALVVAVEWLDDLPCPVVQWHDGWQHVVVDAAGQAVGRAAVPLAARAWAERWWPAGQRAELGLTRDAAWAELVQTARAAGGAALLVDYGHLGAQRPGLGTLAAYRAGRHVDPIPDGQRNLTAHVAVDAIRAAGEQAGATTRWCRRQWEIQLRPPSATGPLTDLAYASERAAFVAPHVWGDFWWLLQA